MVAISTLLLVVAISLLITRVAAAILTATRARSDEGVVVLGLTRADG